MNCRWEYSICCCILEFQTVWNTLAVLSPVVRYLRCKVQTLGKREMHKDGSAERTYWLNVLPTYLSAVRKNIYIWICENQKNSEFYWKIGYVKKSRRKKMIKPQMKGARNSPTPRPFSKNCRIDYNSWFDISSTIHRRKKRLRNCFRRILPSIDPANLECNFQDILSTNARIQMYQWMCFLEASTHFPSSFYSSFEQCRDVYHTCHNDSRRAVIIL